MLSLILGAITVQHLACTLQIMHIWIYREYIDLSQI